MTGQPRPQLVTVVGADAPGAGHQVQWKAAIGHALSGFDFTADEMGLCLGAMFDGAATSAQMAGFLVALAAKGETATEIAGAAAAMRARALPLHCHDPARCVDTCGTGGDHSGTVNLSTLAAMIVAACGGLVAKHGNRALTSQAGSADVLEALGVRVDAPPAAVAHCLQQAGIAFAFAPVFHAATRHAATTRRELGVRTLFNLLGPLTNPAQPAQQVVGVFDQRWCVPMAHALAQLGARRAFVVHGAGNLDEVAVAGTTHVAFCDRGAVTPFRLHPNDFGLAEVDPAGLAGGDAQTNANILLQVLAGAGLTPGTAFEAVANAAVMTAALALAALDDAPYHVSALPGYAAQARAALAEGRAAAVLERWKRASWEGHHGAD